MEKENSKDLWMQLLMGNFKTSKQGAELTLEKSFGQDPEVLKMVEDLTDEDIYKLNEEGMILIRFITTYHKAVNTKGAQLLFLL